MHEFQRFIQSELDARGWRQADLVRRSGLSRQLISGILRDTRDHLGQMPDASTIQGLADGFGVPADRVRTAAARSLVGYVDDGSALTPALSEVSTDALLNEIRRRLDHADSTATPPAAPAKEPRTPRPEDQKTRAGDKPAGLNPDDQGGRLVSFPTRDDVLPEGIAANLGDKGVPDDESAPGEAIEPIPDDDDLP